MSAPASTRFYVQHPTDEYWNTAMAGYVIEAGPIDPSEKGLSAFQRTAAYVADNLKVISPKDFGWKHIQRRKWVECSGPARELDYHEYVALYHSLRPDCPLPKGYEFPKEPERTICRRVLHSVRSFCSQKGERKMDYI